MKIDMTYKTQHKHLDLGNYQKESFYHEQEHGLQKPQYILDVL